jgi:hypothetical protein
VFFTECAVLAENLQSSKFMQKTIINDQNKLATNRIKFDLAVNELQFIQAIIAVCSYC